MEAPSPQDRAPHLRARLLRLPYPPTSTCPLAPSHRDLQPLGLHRRRRRAALHAGCGRWPPPGRSTRTHNSQQAGDTAAAVGEPRRRAGDQREAAEQRPLAIGSGAGRRPRHQRPAARELGGFGFVKFCHLESAAYDKQEINHQIIRGRDITIVFPRRTEKSHKNCTLEQDQGNRFRRCTL
nr:uncharacterized protein LOC127300326 [Lolium perenne]